MANSATNNAEIAMARFKVQTYNWNKPTSELQKIYGVSQKFVSKMRKKVGAKGPRAEQMKRCKEAERLFKCHPEHFGKSASELARIYGVSTKVTSRWLVDVGGNRRVREQKWLNNLICNHPYFGTPGSPAPIPHHELAKILGVSQHHVGIRRRKAGVEPYVVKASPLSDMDRAYYKLCKLTHTWGRPEGIDEHLQRETA